MSKQEVFEELLKDWANLFDVTEHEFAAGISRKDLEIQVSNWRNKYQEASE